MYLGAIRKLGYQVVKPLQPACCLVYLIQREKAYFTIKISSIAKGCCGDWAYEHIHWAYEHIQREAEILERVKDVEGIAHKKAVHTLTPPKNDSPPTLALIKEYIEGKNLRDNYDDKGQPIPFRNKQKLCDTVRVLHAAGVANLDLYPRNIIVDPSGNLFTLI